MRNSLDYLFVLASATIDTRKAGIPNVSANGATVTGIMNTVYFWAGLIAVLVIVIAGFFYVTSNGDSNQVNRAKNAILGAVVGLVVVVMAFTITAFVREGVIGK